ncbi:hypothetical protein [Tengunoibacter tsumagoiensis]|uniref:Glycoside hydrolase family 38 N-terminal domain-containing protein n=1 Tax=Tengunoibacter tsumagoiensis TaxID=2014871 RepID=A0A402A6X1_9CHLR|nr:hypothetical protein [Tengunoibacter tsumagoiensis]GCE14883.1 hypothetical protein KTT_47420 [Tengunoibacter tsumagoiensis]
MAPTTTVYVMQMAHTDLGYTHAREQIELMYLSVYDRVLELCAQTAQDPEPHRFKWTCETAWQVHHYLTHRPERLDEFVHYVRTGQIEVTAAYLHFTDMIDADAYGRSLDWAVNFCREHDLPLRCAVHNDINGWPWSVADSLAERGIPYFCSHVHLDSATDPLGKRGSGHYQWRREWAQEILLPEMPVRQPQAFYWQGPQGGKVLHWLNEHYLLGNVLGVSSSQGFGANKTPYFTEYDRLTADDLYAQLSVELPLYLERLQSDGYPYASLLLSTGGFYVDNAPPDTRWLQVIARWNAEHRDVQLRTALPGEWFAQLESSQPDVKTSWPTHQVAWPDGWAHGLGSATDRIAQARRTQRRRASVIDLVENSASPQAQAHLAHALEEERISLEHTFNAWCSVTQPYSPLTRIQHTSKMLHFDLAELYLDEAVGTALRTTITPAPEPHLFIPVDADSVQAKHRLVHFTADDLALTPDTQMLLTATGLELPFQVEAHDPQRYIVALPTQAVGLTSLQLTTPSLVVSASTSPLLFAKDEQDADAAAPLQSPTTLNTPFWRLDLDPATGGLHHLIEQESQREWVDPSSPHAFGQLVHERVVHPLGRAAVGNTARFIALDVATEAVRKSFAPGPIVDHTSVTMVKKPVLHPGRVYDELQWSGEAQSIGQVQVAWRGYHQVPVVELVLTWDKLWCDLPEAAYVTFPFQAQGGELEFETGGGWFKPGSHTQGGQIPGTISHYYTIQRAARMKTSDNHQLYWLPLDAPLVMPNTLHYNNWETEPWQWNGFLASMPVNHYWHTNFSSSQRGQLRLRYRFIATSTHDTAALVAALPLDAYGWR